MDPLFGSQSFFAQGNSVLERLDRRVSRPVVPISTATLSDMHKKADTVAVGINAVLLVAIASTAIVQGQWPSPAESSSLFAAAFISSGFVKPVRQKLVNWWVNRLGKDVPATTDQMFNLMTAIELHPSLRSLTARAVASTGGQTITSSNAQALIDIAARLPKPPRLPR